MTAVTAPAAPRGASRPRPTVPVPLGRLAGVELRKIFDTRSGLWLAVSVAVVAVGSAALLVALESPESFSYQFFVHSVDYPVHLLMPMLGVLAVTSEWSQRGALTTFALVPRRGRVLAAKALPLAGVAVATMLLTFACGVVATLVGAATGGVDAVWDMSLDEHLRMLAFSLLSMAVGFVAGVVLRSSPAALVTYLLFVLVVPSLSSALAASLDWYRDAGPWVELTSAQYELYGDVMTAEQWAQLGTASLLWLVLPFVLGVRRLLRVEIR